MVTAAVTRLQAGQALEAAGYIRVSRKVQAEGYSPQVQREAIKRLARQEGYILSDDMIAEDHERGSKVTREGYQRIIRAVKDGQVHVVIVYMFDRWGRDGAEWLVRAREFDRLGVPIISVVEGRDEGGLMRFVRAGMAQWFSEQLAQKVRPGLERAAREGTTMGPTPLGYKRVYPAWDGKGKRPHGQLVVDEATAWIVRELYARYDAGGCSFRDLARWLNTDPRTRPLAPGRSWHANTVGRILQNPKYRGASRYNAHPTGQYERAAEGSMFIVEDTHEELVDPALWARVQRGIAAAAGRQTHNRRWTRAGRPIALAASLLRCAGCGGGMYAHVRHDTRQPTQYVCQRRNNGEPCTEQGYKADVVHQALLAEVRLLRGAPWTPQAQERLTGSGGQSQAERVAALRRALEQEKEQMRRHTRRMSVMEEDPTPEQITAFREVSTEISARIRGLEAQLAEMDTRVAALPDLRALHEKLTRTELASAIDTLAAQDDTEGLRGLLLGLIDSAHLVERRPVRHPEWGRVAITWVPGVEKLLDAGLLSLDASPPPPHVPTHDERRRAAYRRYQAKRRANGGRPLGTISTRTPYEAEHNGT